MKKLLRPLATILLAALLSLCTLLLFASFFIRLTLLAPDFYRQVIADGQYIPLVKQSIADDLLAQASYVGVPDEVLMAGLDDTMIHMILRQHVDNLALALNGQPIVPIQYDPSHFSGHLDRYLNDFNAQHQLVATPQQLESVQSIAAEASATVVSHGTLVNLEQLTRIRVFQVVLAQVQTFARLAGLLLLAALALAAALLLIHRHHLRTGFLATLVSIWLAASILLVPAVTLHVMDLPRRLAIQTPYLKFAVDRLLGQANLQVLIWSALFFVLTTDGLVWLFLTSTHRKHEPAS